MAANRRLDFATAQMSHTLIHAQNAALAVVDHDGISDRIEGERPLTLDVVYLLKEQNVLQRQPQQIANIPQIVDLVRLESHLLSAAHGQNAERFFFSGQQNRGDLANPSSRHALTFAWINFLADFHGGVLLFQDALYPNFIYWNS